MRNCNKNVNITLHEIIDEIQLGESTVEIRNAIEIIKFILGFIPVINCITDIYQLVDDVTQALSDDGKISGGEWLALGADVIFLGLDVVAAGDIIKAVKVAKVANTEAKAANNVMDEYVSTPENAGMPNAVKRESRDNLILSY